jgi:hypothetical protein
MQRSTLASMSKEQVLKIALTAGKILLVSGAETYRVEDTMLRICHEGGHAHHRLLLHPVPDHDRGGDHGRGQPHVPGDGTGGRT